MKQQKLKEDSEADSEPNSGEGTHQRAAKKTNTEKHTVSEVHTEQKKKKINTKKRKLENSNAYRDEDSHEGEGFLSFSSAQREKERCIETRIATAEEASSHARDSKVESSEETHVGEHSHLSEMSGKRELKEKNKHQKLDKPEVKTGLENERASSKVYLWSATGKKMEKGIEETQLKTACEKQAVSIPAVEMISSLELLKLIRNREVSHERKIQLAFLFVQTQQQFFAVSGQLGLSEMRLLPPSHFIASLSEWVQTQISSSCKALTLNPTIAANKERSNIGSIGDSMAPAYLDESYEGSFRPKFDLWISTARSCLKLASFMCLHRNKLDCDGSSALFQLVVFLCKVFARFLKSSPNPRKVFIVVVEKLLESLLSLLACLKLQENEGMDGLYMADLKCLLVAVEDIIQYSLFHPSHLEGYFNVCKLSKQGDGSGHDAAATESEGERNSKKSKSASASLLSYHKLLFQQLDHFVNEGKVVMVESYACVFRTYVKEIKGQVLSRSTNFLGVTGKLKSRNSDKKLIVTESHLYDNGVDSSSGKSCGKKDSEKGLFAVFVEILSPLIRKFEELSGLLLSNEPKMLSTVRLLVTAVNHLLVVAIEEQVYVPTEDTPTCTHMNYLKRLYSTLIHSCTMLSDHFNGAAPDWDWNEEAYCLLLALVKELLKGVGHILELEYRVLENDLQSIWKTILSASALQFTLARKQGKDFDAEIPVSLASRVMEIFGELRQVDRAIFSLCNFMRHLVNLDQPASLVKIQCRALTSIFLSPNFLWTLVALMKDLPEGQTTSFTRLLKVDMEETLQFAQFQNCHNLQQAAIRVLTEIYISVLEHENVTSSNSIQVEIVLRSLMDGVFGENLGFLVDCTQSGGNVLANFVSLCAASSEETTSDPNGTFLKDEMTQVSSAGVHTPLYNCTSVLLYWNFMIHLYISTRMLRRKCISLMPHKQAKKACSTANDFTMSILMGEVSCAEQFLHTESFFPSSRKSLLDFLCGIKEWLQETGQKKVEVLQYTLDCVAMLSLSDLKRHITSIAFLLNQTKLTTRDNNEGRDDLKDEKVDMPTGRERLSKVDRKSLQKQCKKLRREASSLTNFLIESISSIELESKLPKKFLHWNKVIGSLDKRTLPVARWALLCQNFNIWSEFASEDGLAIFCRFMFGNTLLLDAEQKKDGSFYCTVPSMTSSLLSNETFYEQEPIRELFLHTVSQELLQTLSALKLDLYMNSPVSFIETQIGSAQEPASATGSHHARSQLLTGIVEGCDSRIEGSLSKELTKCTFLLNVVSKTPKGFLKFNSAAVFISFISKLERSLLMWVLKTRSQPWLDNSKSSSSIGFKTLLLGLDVLLASRRSLESLILHVGISNAAVEDSSLASTLLLETSSMYWPVLSVDAVARFFSNLVDRNSDDTVFYTDSKDKLRSYVRCTTGLFTFVSQNLCRENLEPLLMSYEKEQVPSKKGIATSESLLSLFSMLTSQLKNCSKLMKLEKMKVLSGLSSKAKLEESGRAEGRTSEGCPFGALTILGAISTVTWSITCTLESYDERCHLDKDGKTKWVGQLPDGLLRWMTMVEKFVTDGLNEMLLDDEASSKILSCKAISKSGNDCNFAAENTHTCQDGEDSLSDDSDANASEDSDAGKTMDLDKNLAKIDKRATCSKSLLPKVTEKEKVIPAQASGDFFEMQSLQVSMFRQMLSGKKDILSSILGELFMAMSAILKLKSLLHSPNVIDPVAELSDQRWTPSIQLHLGAASRISQEVVNTPQLGGSSCLILLFGVIKYLESIGSFLPYARPTLSPLAFVDLINTQLLLHGAALSKIQTLDSLKSSDELKNSLQSCCKVFMKKPLGVHYHLALQTVERSLLGRQGRCIKNNNDLELCLGNSQRDSFLLLGGIEFLSIVLDAVSGTKRLQIISKYSSRYLCALFSLIAQCQLGCHKPSHLKVGPYPMSSSAARHSAVNSVKSQNLAITWKCLEILTTFSSREVIFPMKANHLAQAMSCPADLFKQFYQRNLQKERLMQSIFTATEFPVSKEYENLIPDDRLVLEVYIACCKLLRNLLRHRTRESGHCVALLGESLRALLFFLEVMEVCIEKGHCFSELSIQSTVQCASWLKRVYEEVAEHKTILGSYITHMLSDYICIISGYGMSIKGLSREVESILRPGAYALVDMCSSDDLQQLHAVLGEGPRRSALTALRHDYEQHFKYTGKV